MSAQTLWTHAPRVRRISCSDHRGHRVVDGAVSCSVSVFFAQCGRRRMLEVIIQLLYKYGAQFTSFPSYSSSHCLPMSNTFLCQLLVRLHISFQCAYTFQICRRNMDFGPLSDWLPQNTVRHQLSLATLQPLTNISMCGVSNIDIDDKTPHLLCLTL